MPSFGKKFHILLIVIAFALATFFRFWAAPLSSGPDNGQFWAFAKVFQLHGLDFYRYADASLDIFPVKGWGYVYPPVWLLILRLALFATPTSFASSSIVDVSWRIAMKTPIILADLAIGALIYWLVPGPKWQKLLFASLWLFLPAAWYESGVFGQFDAIAVSFLLASLVMFERGKGWPAFLLAGLAVMTKQYTIIPAAIMVLMASRGMSKRRIFAGASIILGLVVILSIPFLLTGNFYPYARSLFIPGWQPVYQHTLVYTFSGSNAFLTYLHDTLGWQTSGLMKFNMPLLGIAVIATIVLCYRQGLTAAQGAFVGSLLFIGLSYQVNYQYLIVLMPLALIIAARARYRSEKFMTLILALLPSVWLWLFDVSFWFTRYLPSNYWVIPILARVGLTHIGIPDAIFVAFAVILMLLCLSCAVLLFTKWHRKPQKEYLATTLS